MPRKKREPQARTQQLWDGEWFRVGEPYYHVCCNPECFLTHYVEFRMDDGVLQSRWTEDKKLTRKAREK